MERTATLAGASNAVLEIDLSISFRLRQADGRTFHIHDDI
jgi:hypothetical protein